MLQICFPHAQKIPKDSIISRYIEFHDKIGIPLNNFYDIRNRYSQTATMSYLSSFGKKSTLKVTSENDNLTAFIYYKNGEYYIGISPIYFLEETYDGIDNKIEYAVLAINSLLIHEGCHAAYSNLIEMSKKGRQYFEDVVGVLRYYDLYFRINNIIEDIYIEQKCAIEQPYLYKFLGLFRRYVAAPVYGYNQIAEQYENEKSASLYLNMLLYHTNPDVFDERRVHDLQWLINELSGLVYTNDTQRLKIAKKVYDYILENFADEAEEEDKKAAQTNGDEGLGDLTEEELEELKKIVKDILDENPREIGEIKKTIDIKESANKYIDDPLTKLEKKIEYIDLTHVPQNGRFKQVFDDNSGGFVEALKSKFRTGIDNVRYNDKQGKLKPARILIGNMFKQEDKTIKQKPPYVAFLMDYSGSTARKASGKNYSISDAILTSTLHCATALRKARINYSVFAHTTGDRDCAVYGVSSYNGYLGGNKRVTTYNEEVEFAKLDKIGKSGNADGGALRAVFEVLDKGGDIDYNDVYIIVVSDGQPTESVWGKRADVELMEEIERLRKLNIKVFSFVAVEDEELKRYCDNLYGSEFSLYSVGESFIKSFRKAVSV